MKKSCPWEPIPYGGEEGKGKASERSPCEFLKCPSLRWTGKLTTHTYLIWKTSDAARTMKLSPPTHTHTHNEF